MSDVVQAAALLLVAIVVFLLISRAMRKREERWESDEWRQEGRPSVGFGNALLQIQALFQPQAKHQVEEVIRQRREDAGPADPPTSGDDGSTDDPDAASPRATTGDRDRA